MRLSPTAANLIFHGGGGGDFGEWKSIGRGIIKPLEGWACDISAREMNGQALPALS